jgi:serine phosphatase RsbU (regulator of sigma subunit)
LILRVGYNSADMYGVLETAAPLLVRSSAQILAQGGPAVSRPQLRWEFASVAVAVTLLAVAIVALALFLFRRRSRDPTLIYFGVFCILYALRLLVFRRSFRALFGAPVSFWSYTEWFITCTINIPFGLFLYQVISAELRRFVRWLLAVQAGFAVFGVVAAALGVGLAKLFIANDILVLSSVAFAGLILIGVKRDPGLGNRFTHEVRVFIAGCAIWFAFVVHANLLGLGILSGHNVEFIGFLVFVGCLGYIAASRTFANEERLLAINKELEIARRIQGSTLPQSVPSLAGLEIAARYVPMSTVAGDFYDFLVVDERRVGVLVADVTGHGVPAALIASMLKTAFAGQAPHASDPARVLTGLNRALCGKFEEHFVTAAYLFVDLETRRLTYSAAGHPPLMLASREFVSCQHGQVREIEENGLMLGIFPEAEYRSAEIGFSSGDRCLLYTDGVLEAKNEAQEEFGKSRCKGLLETEREMPTGGFADMLLGSISNFSGHGSGRAQEDDITLVVLDFQAGR